MQRLPIALSVLLAASAGIHLAVTPEHFQESILFGVFFAVVSAAQLTLAVLVASRPTTRRTACTVVLSGALVTVWALSRALGLPIGPEAGQAEAIFLSDAVATALEIAGIFVGLRLLGHVQPSRGEPSTRSGLSPQLVGALVAVTVAGVAFSSVAQPMNAHQHGGVTRLVEHSPNGHTHGHDLG